MNALESFSMNRRELLSVVGAMGVSFVLPGLSAPGAEERGPKRARSLITLWMAGGPSHLDTWDPHPETKHGGPVKSLKTSATGVDIAESLPRMAEQMHHLNVIRSLVSKEGDHERGTYFVQTGYRPDPTVVHPSLGSILARSLPDPQIEIPQHVSLAAGEGFVVPRGGYLGDEFDAYRIFNPGENLQNMRSRVTGDRQSRRLESLEVVSRQFRRGRAVQVDETMHQDVISRALKMMTSEQLKAFEIDTEPQETIERYGKTQFGRGCLVARRLVEQGVRSVQVVLRGWDTHANNYEGCREQTAILDPAFASLMQDLVDRDLLESTIILCIGEFGRTPQINGLDGRDHWPNGFSCVIGGGGLRSGLLIGGTDPDAQVRDKLTSPGDPIRLPDLYATVMKQMGVDHSEEILTPIGRPITLADGSPITRLQGGFA